MLAYTYFTVVVIVMVTITAVNLGQKKYGWAGFSLGVALVNTLNLVAVIFK